jgi:hypothetical protein
LELLAIEKLEFIKMDSQTYKVFQLIVLSPCNICGQVERFKSADLFNGASIDKDNYLVVVEEV